MWLGHFGNTLFCQPDMDIVCQKHSLSLSVYIYTLISMVSTFYKLDRMLTTEIRVQTQREKKTLPMNKILWRVNEMTCYQNDLASFSKKLLNISFILMMKHQTQRSPRGLYRKIFVVVINFAPQKTRVFFSHSPPLQCSICRQGRSHKTLLLLWALGLMVLKIVLNL